MRRAVSKPDIFELRLTLQASLSPEAPLARVKRLATDSASKLQRTATRVQQQMKKQKLSSWWPWLASAALLLALVGALSMSKGSAAWQKQMSQQM